MSRLVALELQTAAPLSALHEFYGRTLGLSVRWTTHERLEIAVGETDLVFVPAAPGGGAPYYHFAFNIPENQLASARQWQLERTPLLPMPAALHDPALTPDVAWFRSWNAHSIYFRDPAGNVLEHIARHDLPNARPGSFDARSMLCVSEISVVVDDVADAEARLRAATGWPRYRDGDAAFQPMGDEEGLLLLMQRGRDMSLGALAPHLPAESFPLTVTARGVRPGAAELVLGQTRLFIVE